MNAVLQQHTYLEIVISTRTNEILDNRDVQPFSLMHILLVICLCLRKSRMANFTVLNLNVKQPRDLSDLFDSELLILEPWELQF